MAEAEKKQSVDLVEIAVESDNHTHAGEKCQRGDKIKVSKQTAETLKAEWKKQAAKK